jgi:ABC-type lipoprotein release transport system permease subunit
MNNRSEEDIESEKSIYFHIYTIIIMVAAVVLAQQIVLHINDIQKALSMLKLLMR